MTIETTININMTVLHKLVTAAIKTGNSKRNIISLLMKRLSDDHQENVRSWMRVRYQKRSVNNNWKCFHIGLLPDEYEFFLDLRKVCKQSLSRLVAYAVDKYLDEVINHLLRDTDNYRYKNYAIINHIIDGVVCWVYCWGIPRRLMKEPWKFLL